MLVWNEADFISCLECVPEVGEDALSHRFVVIQDGVTLEVAVWQYDGDVAIKLMRADSDTPLFDVSLMDCAGARLVEDAAGARLEFAPAKAFGSRYDGRSPSPFGISVAVKPAIAIRLFSYNA